MLLIENNASIVSWKNPIQTFYRFWEMNFFVRGLIFAIFFQKFVKLVVFKI